MPSVAQAVLSSWSIPAGATFGLLLTAAIYFRGWRSLRSLRPTLFPSWRLACFLAGLAWLWLAIASPLDAFGGLVLTAHMVQHLLLMVVAPPLILLGSPMIPLLRGLPRWAARDGLGPFLNWSVLERLGRILTHPAFCWFAMAVAMLGWHVPAAYELALRSPGWHQVEHACFFITSLLFWWPVIQPWPSVAQWPRWIVPIYLLLGDVVNTILSAFLCFSNRILYPTYAAAPHIFDLAPLDDQVAAGAIMWFVGSLAFLGPAVILTVQLLSPAAALEPPIADPLRSSETRSAHTRFDVLRAPGVGSLLRARYGRRALQSVLLVLALAVIADGLLGPRMSSMNLAGVVPWTYGRALAIIALLAAGNLFCMACPFMLPRELGRRLGFATRRWPRALRTKWLAVGLLVLFFWAFEAFDLWNTPLWTAWIVVAYFASAFLVDTFFPDASFCKYVCPIGQFHFVSSLASPLEVKVRSREVCTGCATHDCLRGNERQRGCELHLFLPRKVGNMDCTFCLDCVKACPHDNIGILPVVPGRNLIRDPVRSSLGRFSHRPDIAALALVLAFSAFASAAAMVAPVAAWRDRLAERFSMGSTLPATSLFFLVALVLAPALMVGFAVAIGRSQGRVARSPTLQSSGDKTSRRELFCRFSLALVPLGLSMWGAHVLFHLLTGWNMPWPVLQRAIIDLGLGWLGRPHWVMSGPLLAADTLVALQLLLLDAGLLLTLYIGWRAANAFAPRVWASLRLFAPWAAVATALYTSGIWVLLQPMQMRGMVQ
jgi:cytochrome c oxidase assembly factor CtaG